MCNVGSFGRSFSQNYNINWKVVTANPRCCNLFKLFYSHSLKIQKWQHYSKTSFQQRGFTHNIFIILAVCGENPAWTKS